MSISLLVMRRFSSSRSVEMEEKDAGFSLAGPRLLKWASFIIMRASALINMTHTKLRRKEPSSIPAQLYSESPASRPRDEHAGGDDDESYDDPAAPSHAYSRYPRGERGFHIVLRARDRSAAARRFS